LPPSGAFPHIYVLTERGWRMRPPASPLAPRGSPSRNTRRQCELDERLPRAAAGCPAQYADECLPVGLSIEAAGARRYRVAKREETPMPMSSTSITCRTAKRCAPRSERFTDSKEIGKPQPVRDAQRFVRRSWHGVVVALSRCSGEAQSNAAARITVGDATRSNGSWTRSSERDAANALLAAGVSLGGNALMEVAGTRRQVRGRRHRRRVRHIRACRDWRGATPGPGSTVYWLAFLHTRRKKVSPRGRCSPDVRRSAVRNAGRERVRRLL